MVLKIFRERWRGGIATQPYPRSPEPAPPAFRGQVILDTGLCQGDGACVTACPALAIAIKHSDSGWIWTLNDARCVFCGLCETACSPGAIHLSTEFELAVRDPASLRTSVIFRNEKSS